MALDTRTEQFLRDFIAWCLRQALPQGSELADLRDRARALLPPDPPVNPLDRFKFVDET